MGSALEVPDPEQVLLIKLTLNIIIFLIIIGHAFWETPL